MHKLNARAGSLFLSSMLIMTAAHAASASTLRIASWNLEADIDGYTAPRSGYNTVLEGIGQEAIGGDSSQAVDILGLEETTSNSVTVQPIVSSLNADYAGASYQMSSYQATESGGDVADGNGPNAIVYNAKTVTLLASVGIDPTGGTSKLGSSSGEYREVVRYEFEAVGTTTPFYVYVAHAKSGTGTSNASDRAKEAAIVESNIQALPTGASVIVMGDLNGTYPEAQFTDYTAAGVTDPAGYSSSRGYYSESSTDLRYRDDYQLTSTSILSGTGALSYVAGSLNNLGNNGTTGTKGSIDSPSTTGGSNTALAYMTTANGYALTQSQILAAETTASDHLPVVADYTINGVPEPTSIGLLGVGSVALLRRQRRSAAN